LLQKGGGLIWLRQNVNILNCAQKAESAARSSLQNAMVKIRGIPAMKKVKRNSKEYHANGQNSLGDSVHLCMPRCNFLMVNVIVLLLVFGV
jgi:membrane protein required for beta-lactamase induction